MGDRDVCRCSHNIRHGDLWYSDQLTDGPATAWFTGHGQAALCFARIGSNRPSSSKNAVNNSSACTTKRFPSSRCASTIQIASARLVASSASAFPRA